MSHKTIKANTMKVLCTFFMSKEKQMIQNRAAILGEDSLKGKIIALGVSGGIACYKAVDLASKLTQSGATVKTIMTENAAKFVTPLSFQTITGQSVLTDLFTNKDNANEEIYHVSISEQADLFVVAPATANIIAKAANGIADDALSTALLAARSPIIIAPAMNNHMWMNPATQHNVEIIRQRGVRIVGPDTGRLACGEEGAVGRLASVDSILEQIKNVLVQEKDLSGMTILITAAGTREPIDPVRFIGNRSSGKMGYAVAEAAVDRGANVILITGPSCLIPPRGANVVNVETAQQMYEAVIDNLERSDAVIMAAAVADVRPAAISVEKIKKDKMPKTIELEQNPDILQAVTAISGKTTGSSSKKDGRIVVGFAAESERVIENATEKLERKGLDMIVANDISAPGVGFDSDLNLAVIIDKNGPVGELEVYKKTDLAGKILDSLCRLR